mgnify:CR=1 FL=1
MSTKENQRDSSIAKQPRGDSRTGGTDLGEVDALLEHELEDVRDVVVALHQQLGLGVDAQPSTRQLLEQLRQDHTCALARSTDW